MFDENMDIKAMENLDEIEPSKEELESLRKQIEIEDANNVYNASYIKTDAIRVYLNELSKIPLLTENEEKELSKRAMAGDQSARKKMIEANLRLVIKIARQHYWIDKPFLDIVQAGNLGLIQAVDKFDYTRGYRFSTYAYWCITQSIIKEFYSTVLKVSEYMYKKIRRLTKTKQSLEQNLKRAPTFKEISDELNISIEEIIQIEILNSKEEISLQTLVVDDGGDSVELQHLIEDISIKPVEEEVEANITRENIITIISETLDPRDCKILFMRYGFLEKEKSVEQIGMEMGITDERVRQILEKTLRRLKCYLKEFM